MRDPTFTTSTQKGGVEVLKFVTCLWILLISNNRSFVHFCEWCGSKDLPFFVDVNYMIPNVKKVKFLALVPVLQWNSHLHSLVYVCSK